MMIVLLACSLLALVPAADADPEGGTEPDDVGPVAGQCVDLRPDDPTHPVDVYEC